MAKSLFPKQTQWGLGLICLFILTSCTKSEGAKAEAFLFNMLSMMGLMAVEAVLVVIIVMTMLLRQNDNYGTKAKVATMVLFGAVAVMLFIWTAIILTDWMNSGAYKYGEGVLMVWGMYFIAIASSVATIVYVRKG